MATRSKLKKSKLPKYVHEIPFKIRLSLCRALDADGQWIQLAAEIADIESDEIKMYERQLHCPNGSATDMILTRLGHRCTPVVELYAMLHRLKLIRERDMLKEIVPPEMCQSASTVAPQFTNNQPPTSHSSTESDDFSDFPCLDRRPGAREQSEHSDTRTRSTEDYAKPLLPPGYSQVYSDGSQYSQASVGQRQTQPVNGESHSEGNSPGNRPVVSPYSLSSMDKENAAPNLSSNTAREFNFRELQNATHNFHDERIIGQGGFGEVYQAQINGCRVAIKRLRKKHSNDDRDVTSQMAEMSALTRYPHPNIIRLFGYSMNGNEPCLVYEFMFNGSLEDRLRCKNNSSPISWTTRQSILLGSACGLKFLHTATEKPLIHGDIKSANILLDQNWVPKIADFGLAVQATGGAKTKKFTHHTLQSDTYFGSIGYLPDSLFGSGMRYNIRTDVYSFGIVIFECCTGLRALDDRRGDSTKKLKDYIESFSEHDRPKLRDEQALDWNVESWTSLMNLATHCSHDKKNKRPEMAHVCDQLHRICQLQFPGIVSQTSTDYSQVERSHQFFHASGFPDPSLQGAPSPRTPQHDGITENPTFDKPASIPESEELKYHEYDKSKLAYMEEMQVVNDFHPSVQRSSGIYSESVDLKHRKDERDSSDREINPVLDEIQRFKRQNDEPIPVLIQRHYDALNTLPNPPPAAVCRPDANTVSRQITETDSVCILKRQNRSDDMNFSVQAEENSDSKVLSSFNDDNSLPKPPSPHRFPVFENNKPEEHAYGNSRPEDHQVELITHQARTMHIDTRYNFQRVSPTHILQSLPPPTGHRTDGHLYQNVSAHRTELQQNLDNECKDTDQSEVKLEAGVAMVPRTSAAGEELSRHSFTRRDGPQESSDPEDALQSFNSDGLGASFDDIEILKHKNLPSFCDDLESESGCSDGNFGFESALQTNNYHLVKNEESGLFERDGNPLYNEHEVADYTYENHYMSDDLPDKLRKSVLPDCPTTPTHSPGLATPTSPAIYANSWNSGPN